MRKGLIAFFLSIFLLSGLLGFGVVREVRAISEVEPAPLAPVNQTNLILVRVNDLSLSQPGLTSIWGVFISRSIFPGLILKRIYPEISSPISTKLGETFSLDQQKQLDPKFLAVMRELDMPAVEIVIVDNLGMADFATAISSHSPANFIMEPQGAVPPELTPLNDLDLFRGICTAIEAYANSVPIFESSLAQVNGTGEKSVPTNYLNKWKGLVTSLHFASCEVLAGP